MRWRQEPAAGSSIAVRRWSGPNEFPHGMPLAGYTTRQRDRRQAEISSPLLPAVCGAAGLDLAPSLSPSESAALATGGGVCGCRTTWIAALEIGEIPIGTA